MLLKIIAVIITIMRLIKVEIDKIGNINMNANLPRAVENVPA